MKSALIYDCLTIKKICIKPSVKLKNLELVVFKCAYDQALKNKIALEELKVSKIDAATIKVDLELVFLNAMSKSSHISLGKKSIQALSYCGNNGALLITTDPCVTDIANILNIRCLQV